MIALTIAFLFSKYRYINPALMSAVAAMLAMLAA